VVKEDFGLTEDEILLLDDKQLNKLVSLKNYRPYTDKREGGDSGET
jgi:KRI1-like family C-terminal